MASSMREYIYANIDLGYEYVVHYMGTHSNTPHTHQNYMVD